MTTTDLIIIIAIAIAVTAGIIAAVASPRFRNWLLLGSGGILAMAAMYLLGRIQEDETPTGKRGRNDTPPDQPRVEDARSRAVDVSRDRRDYRPNFRVLDGGEGESPDEVGRTERLERAAKGE